MANSVDPEQLFASILNSSIARQLFADFSKRHFQMHFFLLAL